MTDKKERFKVIEKEGNRRKMEISYPIKIKQTKRAIMKKKTSTKVARV